MSTIEPTVVVLPSAVWRSELEAELVRLGIDAERAPRAAAKCLGRIVRHAGYLALFQVAGGEEPVQEDDAPVTTRSKGRRRPVAVMEEAGT
jgi:hypothetical protein